jgi:hypothetical protein
MEFSFANATYNPIDKMLQITGDEGLNKLEIQVSPVEEFQTGSFTAVGAEAEKSTILMNDGTTDQRRVQWKFQATDYVINITTFDDKGGRVKGTFSGEMGNLVEKGKLMYVIDGSFDIKRD